MADCLQVVPSQLETILKSHPGVEDAAVVGVLSQDFGELPRAYATRKADHPDLKAESVIQFFEGINTPPRCALLSH